MNIYISNLGDKVTDESLRATFATYGKVNSSRIIMDGFTGYPRGFAFIEMPDELEAVAAIARMHGSILDGRAIGVAEARPGKKNN